MAIRAPVGRDERVRAGPGLRGQGGELRRKRSRPSVALDELGVKGSLWRAGGAGDVDEELTAVRDLRGQRRSDGLEGERQVRRELGEDAVSAIRRGKLPGAAACVEAELGELVADLLIESREEPALVGGGIESRVEVRFFLSQWPLVGVPGEAEVEQQFELRRVRQEKLLVATLLLQPPQLRAAGVRLAERDETEDGDEGEQRGDGDRAEELLRPDGQWDACDRSDERIADGFENPAHARCLRTWSGSSRTWIGFSR